jgi:hypothetical protein
VDKDFNLMSALVSRLALYALIQSSPSVGRVKQKKIAQIFEAAVTVPESCRYFEVESAKRLHECNPANAARFVVHH